MSARRALAALVVIVVMAVTGLTLVTIVGGDRPQPNPAQTGPSAAPSPTVTPTAAVPVLVPAVAYRDGSYRATSVHGPTSDPTQSKVWYANGAWWAVMFEPDGVETHIFRLDRNTQVWQDTGTLVDDRRGARADVVWDGTRAVIASSVDSATRIEPTLVGVFTYDAATSRFRPVPDGPVAVATAPGRAQLVVDGQGTLWLVVLRNGTLRVLHDDQDPYHWVPPVAIDGAPDGSVAEVASAGSSDGVWVVFAVEGQPGVYSVRHATGAADGSWTLETHHTAGFDVTPSDLAVAATGSGPLGRADRGRPGPVKG